MKEHNSVETQAFIRNGNEISRKYVKRWFFLVIIQENSCLLPTYGIAIDFVFDIFFWIFSEFSIICWFRWFQCHQLYHLWIVKMPFFLVLLHICFSLVSLHCPDCTVPHQRYEPYLATEPLKCSQVLLRKWMLLLTLFHNLTLNLKTEAMWKIFPLHNLNVQGYVNFWVVLTKIFYSSAHIFLILLMWLLENLTSKIL